MIRQFALEELSGFAREFWQYVKDAKVFAFHGNMGAGKTTLITALCKEKGVQEGISSPTFSIINEYVYREGEEEKKIYHMDLYRLKDMEEVVQAGVEDCVYSGAICFVEWPEKAPELFEEDTLHVVITAQDEETRSVKILTASQFITTEQS